MQATIIKHNTDDLIDFVIFQTSRVRIYDFRTSFCHNFELKINSDYLQIATVEVPEEYTGPVVELLGKRRGQMIDMQGLGYEISCLCSFRPNYSNNIVTLLILS